MFTGGLRSQLPDLIFALQCASYNFKTTIKAHIDHTIGARGNDMHKNLSKDKEVPYFTKAHTLRYFSLFMN